MMARFVVQTQYETDRHGVLMVSYEVMGRRAKKGVLEHSDSLTLYSL